jgi:hypothetical protein
MSKPARIAECLEMREGVDHLDVSELKDPDGWHLFVFVFVFVFVCSVLLLFCYVFFSPAIKV